MAKVSFRTNVLLKSIIGKDLITDDNIAVLELIKNSFDAGSKEVKIEFIDILHNQNLGNYKKINNSKLIITDYGTGMSEYDLENKWLNIAYSEKKTKKEEHNRTLAGNKGVGRFSCDRLGKFLTIYTKQANSNFIKLFIDWREFEKIDDIDLNIQDIQFELEEINDLKFEKETNLDSFNSGTVLLIESLREEWNHNKVLTLKRQLERLINPNQSFKSEKFDIRIISKELINIDNKRPEHEKVNGLVKNKIFEKLNFKVTSIQSKITSDGKYIITILKDRGTTIFSLVEKNSFSLLKNIKSFVYYLNPYSKAYFMKQTGIRSKSFGSIFLFINGFRIPPYGDDGDDWLGMENRKNQGRSRYLGTREVIGRIEVKENLEVFNEDHDNEEFKIISSRSGVRNNKIFKQLAKSTSPFGYYYKNFRRLEKFVVDGIKWDSVKDQNINEQISRLDWDESLEKYQMDSLTRNKQILEVIDKIIGINSNEIIRLNINKKFVSNLINEQTEKIETDLENIAQELKKKNLTTDEISQFLNKIDDSRKELKTFSDIVSVYNQDPSKISRTEKIILEKYSEAEKEKTDTEKKLKIAGDLAKKKERERQEAEAKLKRLNSENLFLKGVKSQELDEIVSFMHSVGISSDIINNYVSGLYKRVNRGDKIANEVWAQKLREVSLENRKILAISQFATKANFKLYAEEVEKDIIEFTHEYIQNIVKPIRSEDIKVESLNEKLVSFVCKFKPIELTIIIDNLVSNSIRAKKKESKIPSKFLVSYKIENNDSLIINFTDNGIGISDEIVKKIFDFGFTTTSGSGLGLFHIKSIVNESENLSIEVNNKISKGVEFKLKFNK